MANPRYVQRIGRLPQVFEVLGSYPDGISVEELAERLQLNAAELREDLLAFYTADIGPDWLMGLSRPEVLEFLGPDGEDQDPNHAELVRIVDPRPAEELGVEYVDAAELAQIYTAALMALESEGGSDLAEAVAVLEETMLGDAGSPATATLTARPNAVLATLRDARRERRRVRIAYSRAWRHGLSERVIEPYRLTQTRRGWEVDAGVEDGGMRTFLLSNIRDLELLDATFEPPSDLAERLTTQRTTTTVRVRVPYRARWAADTYAEQVRVVGEDEGAVTLDLDLLPPLEHRVGLLLLAAGPDAELLAPPALMGARRDLARQLLEHHQG